MKSAGRAWFLVEKPADDQYCDDCPDTDEGVLDRRFVHLRQQRLLRVLGDALGAGSNAELVEGARELVASGLDLAFDPVGVPGHVSSNLSLYCVCQRRA